MDYILGIESSCDDTSVALVTGNREILANIVISQNDEHSIFGGIVPEIAARSHMQNIHKAMDLLLAKTNITLDKIDVIAATTGPGLIGGVIVGALVGKSLASVLNKPFISVNHLEGHALTVRLTHNINYPYLLLLASGGHCQFVAINQLASYKILGETADDAIGEAFDKVAKMLGLPFPGGPEIEKLALVGDPYKFLFPRPMCDQDNCNLSFSGLKTSVKNLLNNLGSLNEKLICDIAASFQYTIGEILKNKLSKAIKMYESNHPSTSYIAIAGGVAANQYLINSLQEISHAKGYKIVTPPKYLCTDNAAMIAWAGYERFKANIASTKFCPKARWNLEEL